MTPEAEKALVISGGRMGPKVPVNRSSWRTRAWQEVIPVLSPSTSSAQKSSTRQMRLESLTAFSPKKPTKNAVGFSTDGLLWGDKADLF